MTETQVVWLPVCLFPTQCPVSTLSPDCLAAGEWTRLFMPELLRARAPVIEMACFEFVVCRCGFSGIESTLSQFSAHQRKKRPIPRTHNVHGHRPGACSSCSRHSRTSPRACICRAPILAPAPALHGHGAERCAFAALRRQWAGAASSSVAGFCSRVWLCVYLPVTDIDIWTLDRLHYATGAWADWQNRRPRAASKSLRNRYEGPWA